MTRAKARELFDARFGPGAFDALPEADQAMFLTDAVLAERAAKRTTRRAGFEENLRGA